MNTSAHSASQHGAPDEQPGEQQPPLDAVRAMLDAAGPHSRPLRRILDLLADGPITFDALVRESAVPRRTVEDLLAAAGSAVAADTDGLRLVAPELRDRCALGRAETPSHAAGLLREAIESGPAPRTSLDHVTATPDTVVRRAEWLRDHYDLSGANVLCVGDHDLTSLAVALVEPTASVLVVDLDDRVLAHVDAVAAAHDLPVRTLHADLRFGLPHGVQGWADLAFTDPPYTAEGVGLFAARAAECLNEQGRVLLAYGYSDRTPALGLQVQQELLRLGLVFETIVPDFHRYYGAQAIGSASDLFVCRPTSQTRRVLRRASGIYTHGPHSVESSTSVLTDDARESLRSLVGHDALSSVGWDRPLRGSTVTPIFDLRDDPGPWLARMVLACNASSATFLVPNNHQDVADEAGQNSLSDLVAGKFTVRFLRSTPDAQHTLLRVQSTSDPDRCDSVRSALLWRVHGKVGNTWREALIAASGGSLTKREARACVADLTPSTADLDVRLVDLPRHRVEALLSATDQ